MKTKYGLLLAIVLLLLPIDIFACSCAGSRTVCDEYNEADAVILGKVTKILSPSVMYGGQEVGHRIEVAIEKSFKGKERRSLVLSQMNSTCDWQFDEEDEGKKYLLYLRQNAATKDYTVMTCGRSGAIDDSSDDLSWLNALPGSLKRTRFSGTIKHFGDIKKANENFSRFSLIDYLVELPVRIFNDSRTFNTATSKFGMFEIWDIPPGKYKVEPKIPFQYAVNFSMPSGKVEYRKIGDDVDDLDDYTIEVPKQGCAGIDYIVKKAN